MSIDWSSFTPWTALGGGALIGLAAVALLAFNGRIAGISGILGGMLRLRKGSELAWRGAFVLGLLLAPLLYRSLGGVLSIQLETSWPQLLLAGLLVGFGASYGSGCTSGHGVCGISRLSPRSILATLCFMGSGFATVYLLRHVFAQA